MYNMYETSLKKKDDKLINKPKAGKTAQVEIWNHGQ